MGAPRDYPTRTIGPEDATAREEPFFSVLIATYNQGAYVLETLETVARQSFRSYEVVIVNDGSTDDTAARVARWMEEFRRTHSNRVVVSTIPNSGQSAAMEHGFALCSGRYVCLLDSDDRWLDEKLARVFEAAREAPDAGMIVHPLFIIDEEGNRTGDLQPNRARLSEGDLREQLRRTARQVAPATSGVVIRADVFREILPMPTRRFHAWADCYLTLAASLVAPVRALQEPLAEYRRHSDGQHVRTLLTPEGVARLVDLQTAIAQHLGLEEAVNRNSYFVRHVFASAKLEGSIGEQVAAFAKLARATWLDGAFSVRERLLFTGFWTVCLLAPRFLFRHLWRAFQRKQTGLSRMEPVRGGTRRATSSPLPRAT